MPWEKWALGSGDALHTDDYSRAPARPEQTTSAALHPPIREGALDLRILMRRARWAVPEPPRSWTWPAR